MRGCGFPPTGSQLSRWLSEAFAWSSGAPAARRATTCHPDVLRLLRLDGYTTGPQEGGVRPGPADDQPPRGDPSGVAFVAARGEGSGRPGGIKVGGRTDAAPCFARCPCFWLVHAGALSDDLELRASGANPWCASRANSRWRGLRRRVCSGSSSPSGQRPWRKVQQEPRRRAHRSTFSYCCRPDFPTRRTFARGPLRNLRAFGEDSRLPA